MNRSQLADQGTRLIRQHEEEKLFAEMQASKELHKRRKTPEQFDSSLGGGKPFVGGTSSEADGTCAAADDVFARVCGGELGRELCRMAEDHRKNTMVSTVRSGEDELDG